MEFVHVPVMLEECMKGLNLKDSGIYVDCTMGGAGHSMKILELTAPNGKLIAIDQDEQAVKNGQEKLKAYKGRFEIVHDNFGNVAKILSELKINQVDGFLYDIGVSSYQLDNPVRGFSYMEDAPLDMRMDPDRQKRTAANLVNEESIERLEEIIRLYGEENWAKRIAQFIGESRKMKAIETTGELVEIIKAAIPAGARKEGPHPAKRTFQALRIAVNNELTVLETGVTDAVKFLKPGGRICVITFHSLEDRIVKNIFSDFAKACKCPSWFPVCKCGGKAELKLVTKKPIIPAEEEISRNPRARSAKLRIAEKVLNDSK